MKQFNLDKCNITVLNETQLLEINGGKPTASTSLAYDVFWTVTTVLLALGKGAGSVHG